MRFGLLADFPIVTMTVWIKKHELFLQLGSDSEANNSRCYKCIKYDLQLFDLVL